MNDLSGPEKSLLIMVNDEGLKLNLLNIREAAQKIWTPTVRIIKDYTDHGFPHSQRLTENAEKILRPHTNVSLSKEEIYLLLAGIYLHDIGMQCDVVKHPEIKAKAEELQAQFHIDFTTATSSNYTIEEQKALRQNHHYLSAAWISHAFAIGETELGAAAKGIPSYLVTDLEDVCRFHSQLDINQCPYALTAMKSGRKRLVAAILRLSDELDIDKKRVDFAVVKNFALSPGNAVFWWLHELTHVDISANIVTLTMLLHPDDARYFEKLIVEEVIGKFIQKNEPIMAVLQAAGIQIVISATSTIKSDSHAPLLPTEIKDELQRIAALSRPSSVTAPVAPPSPILSTPPLQKFRTLDLELANLRRHPNREDFQQGRYYQNQALHQAVVRYLRHNRRCLILGAPGSGKTALARGVGFALSKETSPWKVYYLSADWKSSAAEWLADLARGDQDGVLFILDNCHQAIEAVNDLLEMWSLIREAHLLLISRDINLDLAGPTEDNYLAALVAETVKVEVDQNTIGQVIHALLTHWQGIGKELGDPEAISQKCQGDLHLLNFYLEAWLCLGSVYNRLSDVPETAVLEDVYRYYLQGKQYLDQLLDIAALSQLEIPVQADWVGPPGVINAIQEDGLVDEIIENLGGVNTTFLQYFHSTPARYLLNAAAHKGRLGLEVGDFTGAALERYLEDKPVNFFGVFKQLYRVGRLDLQHRLLERGKMLDRALTLAREWPDALFRQQFVDISWFIYTIWNWEGRQAPGWAEIFLQEIKNGFSETKWRGFWDRATLRDWNVWLMLGKVAPSFDPKWLSGVDFAVLGRRSRDAGVGTVKAFLIRVSQIGVANEQSKAFCEALDFAALGRSCRTTGVATVRRFLHRCSKVGVAQERLQAFFEALDFAALGQRSRDAGVTTVRVFLHLCSQAGVAKEKLQAFCEALDFAALGQRSSDAGVTTVRVFLQLCSQAGVAKEKLQAFCEALDWQRIGQAIIDDQGGLQSPLFTMHMLMKEEGITPEMAREVLAAIGWETLAGAINGSMSPPDLAATMRCLKSKCCFTPRELKYHGIDFKSPALWFQAFAGNPGPKLDEDSPWQVLQRYFDQALVRLDKNYVQQQVKEEGFTLRGWNILIHNLLQADANRISRDLVPVLRDFTAADYDRLIGPASLKEIGLFMSRFNPREGIFSFQLPTGINFQGIDFVSRVEESTLATIGYFLFDFHFINRGDLSEYFVGELKKDPELILAKIKEAELHEVEFFLWNLWLALLRGEVPFLLNDDKFLEIIREKAGQPQADQEGLLGLLGVFALAGVELPPDLIALTDPQTAKQFCLSAAEKENNMIKLTRLLSGLLYAHPGVLSEKERNRLKESLTQIDQTLQIPNQELARNKILAWLSG